MMFYVPPSPVDNYFIHKSQTVKLSKHAKYQNNETTAKNALKNQTFRLYSCYVRGASKKGILSAIEQVRRGSGVSYLNKNFRKF